MYKKPQTPSKDILIFYKNSVILRPIPDGQRLNMKNGEN